MPRPAKPVPFATRLVRWQSTHGRHGLPWQGTRDAYRIWLSEIMLQQTQVSVVIPYYERFLARWPTVADLARADVGDVMALWSGLGYYARARNLHAAAVAVAERHGADFPASFEALVELPGIGRSTAAAIAAFSSGERRAILDGNVRRVLARHAGIAGDPTANAVLTALWLEAEARLPQDGIEPYTQGLMDLGSGICTTRAPACLVCPVAEDCIARRENRIGELPGRRAKREARTKRIGMLVVLSHGEVLVEKRPPTGIWGGLWSLPEMDEAAAPQDVLAQRWGMREARIEAMPPFTHAFTHYTLAVSPWRVEPVRPQRELDRAGTTWLPLTEIAGAALPAPVKSLLARLGPAA